MVEEEAVVVESAKITGWVKPVGAEQVLATTSAYPAQRMWSPNLDHPNASGRNWLTTVGIGDPHLHAGKRLAAAAPRGAWHIGVGCGSRSTARRLRSCRTALLGSRVGHVARQVAVRPDCRVAVRTSRPGRDTGGAPAPRPGRANRERVSPVRAPAAAASSSGCGIFSVINVAPATSVDSTPLPKPPTQKKGIGRYRRVSESIQRLANPDRTAPSALPCECTTPLGGPLLPDVNMMTIGSLGVTVAVTASTIEPPDQRPGHPVSDRPPKPGAAQEVPGSAVFPDSSAAPKADA